MPPCSAEDAEEPAKTSSLDDSGAVEPSWMSAPGLRFRRFAISSPRVGKTSCAVLVLGEIGDVVEDDVDMGTGRPGHLAARGQ